MARWQQHLKDLFGRSAPAVAVPAAAPPPMPASNMPAPNKPVPDQSADEMYAAFEREIKPVLVALRNLPRNEDGLEFFMRADVVTADMTEQAKDMRIDVWLFYTRETAPAGKLHQAPNSHMISMESKWSTPEKPDFSQLLALGNTPVLRLSVRPPQTGDTRITSHTYVERYEKPQAGKKYSIYSGDYGMVHDESEKIPYARVEHLRAAIDGWLQTYAPAQKRALQDALNPKTDFDLLRPLNIRKRQP